MQFSNKEQTKRWAEEWAQTLRPGDVISLEGDLGAGKTQLVQWVVRALGGTQEVTSPTFALVNHYPLPDWDVYHLDLYRLEDEMEIEEIDYETYFYPEDAITFVEWASQAESYLPQGMQHVRLTSLGGEAREVETWQD